MFSWIIMTQINTKEKVPDLETKEKPKSQELRESNIDSIKEILQQNWEDIILTDEQIQSIINCKEDSEWLDRSKTRYQYRKIRIIENYLKNWDKTKMRNFIKRKKIYLENNRTIPEGKFIELFWWAWKYWKTEINQRWIWICYAYTWFEILKKTNWFDELIQTNLKETLNWREVRLPFCDKNWKWIKVNKEEIDKEISITDRNWNTEISSINSESEYLWFKILEIAFIKWEIIYKYKEYEKFKEEYWIIFDKFSELENAYKEFIDTWNITISWKLINLITSRFMEEMLDVVLPKDYIIQWFDYENNGRGWLNDKMKDSAFDWFSTWLFKIELEVNDKYHPNDSKYATIIETPLWIWGTIIKNPEIINSWWIEITNRFLVNGDWKIIDKKNVDWNKIQFKTPDIVTNTEGENMVLFFENHSYSIEKCYIDKNTWEKRVWIINPRHTWIKFDVSLEECKKIFKRDITWINIDKMFR